MLTMDILPKMVTSLKQFSSMVTMHVAYCSALTVLLQTDRLLLEAQVVHLPVGVKKVTAKHLALSSQALRTLVLLVPSIRARFEQHLPAQQRVSHDRPFHLLLT